LEGTGKLPKFDVNILKSMWINCSNKVATALSEMIKPMGKLKKLGKWKICK